MMGSGEVISVWDLAIKSADKLIEESEAMIKNHQEQIDKLQTIRLNFEKIKLLETQVSVRKIGQG